MSGCNTCGGSNSSTPSGGNWVTPSNPCENEELTQDLPEVISADAPACDSIKTVHVISGPPVGNDPCASSSTPVVVNETCGEQAPNALYDVTVSEVAVPAVGGSLPISVADATRYWPGLGICVGTATSHFFAKVVSRSTVTNIIIVTRVAGTGSADDGTLISACSPIIAATPSAGNDFCLFDSATGESNIGDLLLFSRGDGCSAPVALPSTGGGLLYSNATSGAKSWIPVSSTEGYYVLKVDAEGNISVVTLDSALTVVRPSVINSVQYFEATVPATSTSTINLSPFVNFNKTMVLFDWDCSDDANAIVTWAWNVDGESIDVSATGGVGTATIRLQVIEFV